MGEVENCKFTAQVTAAAGLSFSGGQCDLFSRAESQQTKDWARWAADRAALCTKPVTDLTESISAVDSYIQPLINELSLTQWPSAVWTAQPSYGKHFKCARQNPMH